MPFRCTKFESVVIIHLLNPMIFQNSIEHRHWWFVRPPVSVRECIGIITCHSHLSMDIFFPSYVIVTLTEDCTFTSSLDDSGSIQISAAQIRAPQLRSRHADLFDPIVFWRRLFCSVVCLLLCARGGVMWWEREEGCQEIVVCFCLVRKALHFWNS